MNEIFLGLKGRKAAGEFPSGLNLGPFKDWRLYAFHQKVDQTRDKSFFGMRVKLDLDRDIACVLISKTLREQHTSPCERPRSYEQDDDEGMLASAEELSVRRYSSNCEEEEDDDYLVGGSFLLDDYEDGCYEDRCYDQWIHPPQQFKGEHGWILDQQYEPEVEIFDLDL